ncbi:MAG: GntR family transcriptional regulator [Cetobacterium sp.]|uniref:DNA-binding transcriptional regulator, GntR family n=1 Tax=Cetobacterium ceti TaxID=180163 RepID=A0A1T4KVC7_9FUSO|nr:GntR family transcriptional regulator [Cetobacterium ceti]MCJ8342767.1 GntR family transcriptional regulator [Cetobacterium sp.]SJZ46330.1 DNA-binding transcriptional regulator, GntR family [Cetobacterium ceti]
MIQKNKPIREQVYEQLKEMIIAGEIASGERIVELEYAEKFNISRTPIREAIRMLELEGLVEVSSKGGVIVKKITKEDIREIYKIRIALEGIIIEELINSGEKKLENLEELLSETRTLMSKDENSKEVIEHFAHFNSLFYSLSNLKRVVEMINNINLYLRRFRMISLNDKIRRRIAYDEHVDLVKEIKNKNLPEALRINRKHLEDSMNFLLKRVD